MQEQFEQKENPLDSQVARPNFWNSLEKNQKIALIVLAVFVLFLMITWTIQFRRSLTEPFAYKGDDNQVNTTQEAANAGVDLKNKDTDSDWLSDYDEQNIYKTSPYLEDTDGDGIKDSDEIKAGSDPNCPVGKSCVDGAAFGYGSKASDTPAIDLTRLDLSRASTSQADIQGLLQGVVDATRLRKMLLDSGMDQKVLDQINDDELVRIYRDNLAE